MISPELAARIRRLHFAEHWKVGTICSELGVHHDTVRRALALYDRVVVAVAPILLGKGTDAVGDLGASLVQDGLRLVNRTVHQLGPDLVVAGDLDWARG